MADRLDNAEKEVLRQLRLLKVLLYTALYGVGILLEWRVNPWILNKILDFSKFFE